MSKLAPKSMPKGPSKSSLRKPSAGSMKPSSSKANAPKPNVTMGKQEVQIPAFSILPKKPKPQINWDLMKRDMVRRQAPEGEDKKAIRMFLREIEKQKLPVHEFINLVSAYTADNGAVLRSVMEDDVTSFRKLARKVYETMTQDVSDVLVNEQLHMMLYYQERHDIFREKLINAINEIYEMAPKFDFEKYFKSGDEYLNFILPLPADHHKDEEQLEMQRRQQAYHRLQWLRSEGERMSAENKRLQERLKELKEEQQREQSKAAEMAAAAEAKRQKLVQEETQMKDTLEKLNVSVGKSFIENEAQISKEHNQTAMNVAPPPKKPPPKRKRIKKPEWVSEIASEIEQQATQEVLAVEQVPAVTLKRGQDPCSCSPDRTNQGAPRQTSPFHYSPDRSYQPPAMETHIEEATTTIQQRRPPPPAGPVTGRRGAQAPRDTWGGFY